MNSLTQKSPPCIENFRFHKDLFEKLANEKVDHTTIVSHFEKVFENKSLTYKPHEVNEFIYDSLETVRRFYLRLFSETESLPDFVNRELDTLSEWREIGGDTFKLSLASALCSLISQGKPCTVDEIAEALVPYLKNTEDRVLKQWNLWKSKDSQVTIMKLICLYQIEESMRIALTGHYTQATSQIFTNSILTH